MCVAQWEQAGVVEGGRCLNALRAGTQVGDISLPSHPHPPPDIPAPDNPHPLSLKQRVHEDLFEACATKYIDLSDDNILSREHSPICLF